MRRVFKILLTSFAVLLFVGCRNEQQEWTVMPICSDEQLDSLEAELDGSAKDVARYSAIIRWCEDNGKAAHAGTLLRRGYSSAVSRGDRYMAMVTSVFLSNIFFNASRYDSTEHYLSSYMEMEAASGVVDTFYSAMAHNLSAVCVVKTRLDYTRALSEYLTAYGMVSQLRDTANMSVILSNISTIYSIREDTSGLRYARLAYEYGKAFDSYLMHNRNALQLASQYYLMGNMDSARFYVNESFRAAEGRDIHNVNMLYAYRLSGLIYQHDGRPDMAESEFRMAMKYIGSDNEGMDIKLWLSYGDLLMDTGNPAGALACYEKGLAIADSLGNVEVRYKLLYGLHKVYDAEGDLRRSFDYYKKYIAAKDTLFNLKKEQEFAAMQMNYEKSRHREQLQAKELEVVKSQRAAVIAAAIIVIVIMLLVYSAILHRKRNQMYANLARQYNNFRIRYNEMAENERKRREPSSKADSTLFGEVEKLMKEQFLYRRKDVSVTLVAELLSSNPTYISKVTNHYSGMSFPNYINSFRVNEAISILSDPTNDMLLKDISDKVGYTSLSTFYRAFIKETGCSPSQYREEMGRVGAKDPDCNS